MDSVETKEKILNEALKLFMKNGYDKTSLNDIAKRIKITKPALYYYFKNKDELFLEVTNMFLSIMNQVFISMLESANDIKTLLQSMFCSLDEVIKYYQSIVIDIKDDTALLRSYFFIYDAMKKFPDFRKKLANIYNECTIVGNKLFIKAKNEEVIRDDLDYEIISYEINALVEGLLLMNIINAETDLKEMGKKIFDNYWKRLEK